MRDCIGAEKVRMKKLIIIAAAALVLFVLLAAGVKTVDVKDVEATGKTIGLAWLNTGFHKLTGVKMGWYKLTQITGIIALLTVGAFAVLGLVQLIKRRSLKKVDPELLTLGGLFVATAIAYVLFELIKVNYRPIIMPGAEAAEASFPSSHTMLIVTVMGGTILILDRYIKDARLCVSLRTLCVLIALITVFGRLISGVHWFTDIVAALLLSTALLARLYEEWVEPEFVLERGVASRATWPGFMDHDEYLRRGVPFYDF